MSGLPYTQLGFDLDAPVVEACIGAGMIVIVETNDKGEIFSILSAHTGVQNSYDAYQPFADNPNYAVIIPGEHGPSMFYQYLTYAEMRDICNR